MAKIHVEEKKFTELSGQKWGVGMCDVNICDANTAPCERGGLFFPESSLNKFPHLVEIYESSVRNLKNPKDTLIGGFAPAYQSGSGAWESLRPISTYIIEMEVI